MGGVPRQSSGFPTAPRALPAVRCHDIHQLPDVSLRVFERDIGDPDALSFVVRVSGTSSRMVPSGRCQIGGTMQECSAGLPCGSSTTSGRKCRPCFRTD
jgi:hypothetical protein